MALAVNEFYSTLGELSRRAGSALDRVIAGLDRLSTSEALALISEAYPSLMTPYLSAAGELTAQWYAEQPAPRAPRGAAEFLPEAAALPADGQLAATARWASTRRDPAGALSRSSERHILTQSRRTVYDNVEREGVRYAREARKDACGFCRMLATRAITYKVPGSGSLYRTEYAASRAPHRREQVAKLAAAGHDGCNCRVIPVRNDDYTPKPWVQQWTEDYYAVRKSLTKRQQAGETVSPQNPLDIARAMEKVGEARESGNAKAIDEALTSTLESLDQQLRESVAPDPPPVELDLRQRLLLEADEASAAGDWLKADELLEKASKVAEGGDLEPVETLSKLDLLLAQATAAGDEGDWDKADKLFAQAAKLEAKEQQQEAEAAEQSAAIIALIDQGWDPAEAESEVTGVSVERIRRRDFIERARAEGHRGAGFDALLGQVHAAMAAEQYWAAEAATNGYMVKRRYEGRFDPQRLWNVNEDLARKVMSEEMAAWFDENGGRITRAVLREAVLAGSDVFDMSQQRDFLQ